MVKEIMYPTILVLVILLMYGFFSTFFYEIKFYTIKAAKLYDLVERKHIVVLSDLHNCIFGIDNRKLIKDIQRINPEFIIIAGDLVNHHSNNYNKYAKRLITELSKRYMIFYGDGNHEQGFFEACDYTYDLEKFRRFYHTDDEVANSNIIHLHNDKASLSDNVNIYGLTISREFYKRYKPSLMSDDYIEKLLGKLDDNCYNILVAHNPVHFKKYANWGADLVLSGHMHGGIIRIPFKRGLISPQLKLLPKYAGGKYKKNNSTMIVSRGLGVHTIRFRLFNEPELIVLNITK